MLGFVSKTGGDLPPTINLHEENLENDDILIDHPLFFLKMFLRVHLLLQQDQPAIGGPNWDRISRAVDARQECSSGFGCWSSCKGGCMKLL